MLNTKIEWTHHTVNFWWGCKKVSPGCANCYAAAIDRRYHGGEHWGTGKYLPRLEKAREECLRIERRAAKDGKPVKVFVNSMSDWLDPDVPIEWLAWLLDTIRMCPHVTLLLLTKRPELWLERMNRVLEFIQLNRGNREAMEEMIWNWVFLSYHPDAVLLVPPANVWIGVTVENQPMADQRIPDMFKIPAALYFVSYEPALGPINLRKIVADEDELGAGYDALRGCMTGQLDSDAGGPRLSWVICGGESGPNARPMHPDWVRSMRDQCKAAGVPFFFKSWGEWAPSIFGCCPSPDLGEKLQFRYFEPPEYRASKTWRFGKARAGHLLDGVEHNEFPKLETSHV